jgi:predicted DNA binding protein
MAAIAQFALEPEAVPLYRLFDTNPEATIELERVVPLQNRVIPYFWISDVNSTTFDDGFDSDREIARLKVVDELGSRVLVRVEWTEDHNGLSRAIEHSEVTLLSAVGTADGWQIEVQGDDRASISRFHDMCAERGVPARLVTLHRLTPETDPNRSELSSPQREALLFAYEQGYYDSPRTTHLSDIAEHFGISRQAVSNRLKRGTRHLIESVLLRPEK